MQIHNDRVLKSNVTYKDITPRPIFKLMEELRLGGVEDYTPNISHAQDE